MQNLDSLKNVISIQKTNRDYCEDKFAAKDLAQKILDFWHEKGHKNVKVWLEPEDLPSGRKRYNIRSNIVFRVPS